MKRYNVEVKETLSKIVMQEANTFEEAALLVKERYDEEDIILNWADHKDTDYIPADAQTIDNNFQIKFIYDKNKKQLIVEDMHGSISNTCKTNKDLKALINEYFKENVHLSKVKPIQYNKEHER